MEAGWVVSEVGRQPWIVYNYMKVEDAATGNTGVWITFLGWSRSTSALGVTTILVLRGMSRRFREESGFDETDTPYGPIGPIAPMRRAGVAVDDEPVEAVSGEHRRWRCAVRRRHRLRAVRRRRLRGRVLGPARRGSRARRAAPRRSSTTRSGRCGRPTTCGSSSASWCCGPRFPTAFASITLTLFVPLTIAAFGIVLRGSSFAFRKAVFRTRDRRNFGAAFAISSVLVPVLHGRGGRRPSPPGRVPAGGKAGDPVAQLDQPHLDPGRRAGRDGGRLPRGRLPGLGRRPPGRRRAWSSTSVAGPWSPPWWPARWPSAASSSSTPTRPYLYHGLTTRALPLVDRLGDLRRRARWCCSCAAPTATPACWPSARWPRVVVAWGVAQWPYVIPQTMTVSQTAAPVGHARGDPAWPSAGGGDRAARAGPALRARPAGLLAGEGIEDVVDLGAEA